VTFVVLFILAVVWALYLASWLRSRAQGRRSNNSIASFNKHLSVLERARPAGVESTSVRSLGAPRALDTATPTSSMMPTIGGRNPATNLAALNRSNPSARLSAQQMTLADARRRRRDVLAGLGGFAVFTLAIFLLVGGPTIYLQLLADVLLVGYVGLLAYSQRLARERREKVRYLHHDDDFGAEPAYLLQSSAN
jgi:Flp pilus assembly protein TadB